MREKDDIVNDAKSVAKIFNEYFTGIASDIGFNDPIPDDYGKDEVLVSLIAKYDNHPSIISIRSAVLEHGTFEFEQVDINQIYQILVKMNDKKATGYDGIPCKLLKLGAFPLAGILCKLINISISECKFPDVLKLAEISALFKKIDRLCKDNYRPVSILTALSKVFERCHSNQLLFYFEKLFSKFLSGFRKGYSCQSTLLRMIEDWKSSLDNGNNVGTIAVDLSKAFDSLPHGLLVAKLFAYGVTLPACKLLCSYLHNRHQRVKISDAKSDWLNIEKGVPQGSILGPLLFNIFINDIFFIDNDVTMYNYADDNCIAYAHRDIETIKSVLERDIKKMLDWFKNNSLQANPSKFQSMLLKNKTVNAEDFNIIVDNDILNLTDDMTVLGINIDNKLNFNSHVSSMCNKAGRQLNVLQRLKGSLDYASRLSIYKSFIMSNFNYCPVVWMFTSKSSLLKLETIQKRALRFVLDDYASDYHDLLKKADVPGMKIMALRCLAIEVYKCINGLNPKYLNDLFIVKKCKYNLRDDSVINRNKVQTTNYGLKSFKDYGAKIWNVLPDCCKGAVSLDEFKVLIKSWNGPKCSCSVCLHFIWTGPYL